MQYNLIKVKNDFIHFEIIGKYNLNNGKKLIIEIYNLCLEKNINKLLVDITKKEGAISTTDRFIFGELIAKMFPHKIKFAVIGKKDQINKFSETVAYNRGSQLQIFSNKTNAIKWLME